jgi:PTH1 family peptidyl-tRNA hydrolase
VNDSAGSTEHRVIVLLGNPGDRYAATRHNIGWWVGDLLAERRRLKFKPGPGDYYIAEGRVGGRKARLLKATTYMNESGRALAQYADRYNLFPQDLIVVADDIDIPLGLIRIRAKGSSGGHNGLASVIEHVGSEEIARCRCGVGPVPPGIDPAEFVLDPFESGELITARQMAAIAADAVETMVARGVSVAANTFNRKPPAPGDTTSELPGAE